MRQIALLLNKLSLANYKDSSGHLANMVGVALLAVVLLLCWTMASRTDKKLAFLIDEVELTECATLTVGERSAVHMKGVPHDYLKITYSEGAYQWEVNPQYHDSLQYFKINNVNPNKHAIRDDAQQHIRLRLPTSQGDTVRLTFTGADVWKTWKQFKNQKDVLVRHFAARYGMDQADTGRADSLRLLDQMQQSAVHSFFERTDGDIVLVILDELTQIEEGGQTVRYARSGTADATGAHKGLCKVQFFHISDNCFMDSGHERGYFEIDEVNYVMKPLVTLTSWGAGHVMISAEDEHLKIRFPRPITYIGSVDSLRKMSAVSSGLITLKQNYQSYPTKSDIYLPAFSNAINFDLCHIEFFHGKDTVCISDNNRHRHVVENPTLGWLPLQLTPTFSKLALQSGKDTLHCRAGYINRTYIMGYLWLPLLTVLVLLTVIWMPGSVVRVSGKQVQTLYNFKQVSHYPSYLTMLTLVALCYCICKTLITLKLSYTHPYFEKLTGITPVSTSLMLLLFFSVAMLINTPLLHTSAKRRPLRLWLSWGICTLWGVFLGYAFFGLLDTTVSQSAIRSYFHSEVYTLWPWKWLDAYGINDTHRSVVYALLFAEATVLALWAVLNSRAEAVTRLIDKHRAKWSKWAHGVNEKTSEKIRHYLRACPSRLQPALLILAFTFLVLLLTGWSTFVVLAAAFVALLTVCSNVLREALKGALTILYPSHLLLLVVLAFIGNKFGNFGTAFITLIVILGMTQALSEVKIEDAKVPRPSLFWQMFIITAAYIVGAMAGDNGYMTNYLGFAMCLLSLYFLLVRPRANIRSEKKKALQERRWVNGILIMVVTIVISLPFLCSVAFSPSKVDYSRLTRRVMLFSNFSDLERNGYRYNESDAEFMVIMSHYMQTKEGGDPLSNDTHFLHPSISTGQSPVVLNDLSAPAAFFGAYGTYLSTAVFALLLFLLIWLVLQYSLSYTSQQLPLLTKSMQWRMLAMYMWVGTSFYIYLSYIATLPYTGRLIPGFGVDAVGEALESAILLAFMASVTCRKKPL